MLSLLLLYYLIDRTVGLGGLATRFLFVWTLGSSQVALWGTAVATESLFTALTCAAILLFAVGLKERARGRRQLLWFIAANLLVGLSYWVRYAGLFFFASTAVYVAYLSWRYRDRTALRAAVALPVSGAIIGVGCLRNQLLVGTWKGGNTTPGRLHLVDILRKLVASVDRILLGDSGAPGIAIADALFLLGLVAALVFYVRPRLRRTEATSEAGAHQRRFLASYALIYSGSIIYAALTSPISFAPRMFYPLLPVVLLMGADLIRRLQQRPRFVLGLALTTGAFLTINFRNYLVPPQPAPHQIADRELAQEIDPGMSLRAWLDENVPKDEPIVANWGQGTGYLLQRNTVSLVSHTYSDQRWDEPAVRALMQTYRARYLTVYTDDPENVTRESLFLSALVQGACPSWLTLAARARDVLVFRRSE
jgi:hypothetical protein